MTAIHDTIYPRLKTIVSPEDLERVYTPTPDECGLAAQVAQDDVAYLGFLIYLKTFQRLGYWLICNQCARPNRSARHSANPVTSLAL